MFYNVPNPPKFPKKIVLNLKRLLIAVSDIMWFSVITAIFIPMIALIPNTTAQIVLALSYIIVLAIILWRWEDVWLRDLIGVAIKSIFIKKELVEKEASEMTFLGEYENGYFLKNNIYSKYYAIQSSYISLIRDIEIDSRIESLNNFFMFSEKLRENKIDDISFHPAVDEAKKLLANFCTKDDLLNVPQKILFELFDQYCDSIGVKRIYHKTVGRAIREMYNVRSKPVRFDGEVVKIYVNKED